MKSHVPRSLRIFRELQNSRVFDPLRHAAILFPKNPCALGAFQWGIQRCKQFFPVQKALHVPGVMDLLNCDCPSVFMRVSQFPSQRVTSEGFFAFCRVPFFGSFLWARKEMNGYRYEQ